MGYTRLARRQYGSSADPGSYSIWYGSNEIGPYSGSNAVTSESFCSDTVEAPPFTEPHALTIIHRDVNPARVSGERNAYPLKYVYDNYNTPAWTAYTYVTQPPPYDYQAAKSKAIATLNPFAKPKVDLPVFLFEFKDMPRMLRDLGRVLKGQVAPGDVPGGFLSYHFGWGPLIRDTVDLLGIGDSINNRIKYFQDTVDGSQASRKVGKAKDNSTWETTLVTGLPVVVRRTDTERIWTSARVKLEDDFPRDDVRWEAIKATLGLNLSGATLWEALPWSWLLDYFGNIGDIMEARRGYSRWSFSDMFIMCTSSRVEKLSRAAGADPGLTLDGGARSCVIKQRTYVGANPNLSLSFKPILTRQQMTVLGSLALAAPLRRVPLLL